MIVPPAPGKSYDVTVLWRVKRWLLAMLALRAERGSGAAARFWPALHTGAFWTCRGEGRTPIINPPPAAGTKGNIAWITLYSEIR